ncbi:proline dehydrogenase family protein [Streptomyces sp. NPDC100445]|uniref:proline dehydrogenase family protein n=1 Tax=Streptomyces sp. NPDC100445 TaxID=3366102 RepID=UPI003826B7C1
MTEASVTTTTPAVDTAGTPDRDAGLGLRLLAADDRCRRAFAEPGSLLRQVAYPAARRYLVADDLTGLLPRLDLLRTRGYRVSAEYVGEEIRDEAEIEQVVQAYLDLLAADAGPLQLGFDLSNVGLLVSRDLAVRNTSRLLTAAAARGSEVVLSMERSDLVDEIVSVFAELATAHHNVGITVQAHLHRTERDLPDLVALGRKIRLVKGVYAEAPETALGRGPELDERYLEFAEYVLGEGARLALATQHAELLATAGQRGLLAGAEEIEMLHGVRPALLRHYREAGYACRVYATYGRSWWLHLLHRLAEHPAMALRALADLADPSATAFGTDY